MRDAGYDAKVEPNNGDLEGTPSHHHQTCRNYCNIAHKAPVIPATGQREDAIIGGGMAGASATTNPSSRPVPIIVKGRSLCLQRTALQPEMGAVCDGGGVRLIGRL
ncbi:hypothetical protein ASPBRDRAFT_57229 [Aspergillus brasiliensis CBS 101740]|uniref:Uncharacterized protein n=1 Tax=Aspergillus brasiliensis (strain CBS 101740 / IMI 381727 / IBT 21946) TaxID=767769 RepID=A0A1L9UD43_ASPBC|nr:hypothetical protein ASPBRDRAFT_57229 [Aspergillus brasiliensis CBS 101740]